MPLVRYFLGVGGALLALLFALNIYLPTPPALPQQQVTGIDKSTIRITATQKGPERVVIDTSLPTIVPSTDVALAQIRPVNGAVAQAAPRDSFAQMTQPQAKPATVAAVVPKKPKVRVAHTDTQRRSPQPARIAQASPPSFFGGLFGGSW